jgi:GABA(A) receptor-associated protein
MQSSKNLQKVQNYVLALQRPNKFYPVKSKEHSSLTMASTSDIPFKSTNSFEARLEESRRIREKFPGRVPVIVERGQRSSVPSIDKQKFLVPGDLTVSQFIFVIRKRLNLPSEQALFLFIGNMLPTTGMLIRELHASYADADGFLYATYCGENVFG